MRFSDYKYLNRPIDHFKPRPNTLCGIHRQSQWAPARLPDGLRIYAIGDIHGCADLLVALLRQIDVDCILYPSSRPIVVFIGDFIDRGPASREVLDLLLGCERTKESVCSRAITRPSFIAF
jgi:hypothetical protein